MADNKKIILITGANSGIGFEIAFQLLADTNVHILLGSRSIEKGQEAIRDLESRNVAGSVELIQIDVADENSIKEAAELVEQKHGRLDALVNNAGMVPREGSLTEQFMTAFKTNAVSCELNAVHFAPLLKKSTSSPRIVFISSGGGSLTARMDLDHPYASLKALPYRVSKAAMNMIFASQFYEFRNDFKMFIYGPGLTKSNLGPGSRAGGNGCKPTSEGARPAVEMLRGERDHDAGKYVEYGEEIPYPW